MLSVVTFFYILLSFVSGHICFFNSKWGRVCTTDRSRRNLATNQDLKKVYKLWGHNYIALFSEPDWRGKLQLIGAPGTFATLNFYPRSYYVFNKNDQLCMVHMFTDCGFRRYHNTIMSASSVKTRKAYSMPNLRGVIVRAINNVKNGHQGACVFQFFCKAKGQGSRWGQSYQSQNAVKTCLSSNRNMRGPAQSFKMFNEPKVNKQGTVAIIFHKKGICVPTPSPTHRQNSCHTFGCSCQGISNKYGTNHNVTWGRAPHWVRQWWLKHRCTTRPPSASGVNLALHKRTWQSSTYPGGDSRYAVSGRFNGNYRQYRCTHTNKQSRPWWIVDLGGRKHFNKVTLFNRRDCCSGRLRKVLVDVSNDARHWRLVGRRYFSLRGVYKVVIPIPNNTYARYVRVLLNAVEFLTLCQVQITNDQPKSHPCPCQFYQHCSYRGWSRCIKHDTKSLGGHNDQFSSVRVAPGWKCHAYEHNDYRGKSITFNSSDSCLTNNHHSVSFRRWRMKFYSWNDRISSVKPRRK